VFGLIQGIAVQDGVDQGLVNRQMNAENVAATPSQRLEPFQDIVQQLTPDGRIALDELVTLPNPVVFGRRHVYRQNMVRLLS
jgi:hypothetical protein